MEFVNSPEQQPEDASQNLQTRNKGRLLIFIVAYNAEKTIEDVLKRIPVTLAEQYEVEVLIIDDSSQDETFLRSEAANQQGLIPFKLTVLFNPVNQGYGGNQKIGFHYAVENGFDWVALVHGDGQYAPECLPELVAALASGEAEAVFGSRMIDRGGALQGGMPLYKFVGNKVLTGFQNLFLGTRLSEFHSGYRLYSTQALARVPFGLNSNDFHFDTEIIIQFVLAGHRIKELPIPTFYGDEICHVNGLQYAWNVCKTTMQARVQRYHIFYDRKFNCLPPSSQTSRGLSLLERTILRHIERETTVLVVGGLGQEIRRRLAEKGCVLAQWTPEQLFGERPGALQDFDALLLMDGGVIGLNPEEMVTRLKAVCVDTPDIRILLSVGNVAFGLTRLLLLLGRFSYTRRGIINFQQFRLFTRRSLRKLFVQNGFRVELLQGVAIPFERLFSRRLLSGAAEGIHKILIRCWPAFFSYQFLLIVKPLPSLPYLLRRAEQVSALRKQELQVSNPAESDSPTAG